MDPTLDDLRHVVQTCPAIDNHAHNILLPSHEHSYNLLSATTEATGDALQDAPRALPHLRMVRQLRELYGCDKHAGWEDLMKKRQELLAADAPALFRKCFENIYSVLMDDGLDDETVHPYMWHDQFTPCKTFRIVRIETIAAEILRGMYESGRLELGPAIEDDEYGAEMWIAFLGAFETIIADFIRDDEVVGFKSVICYRTGLDVNVSPDVEIATNGLDSFRDEFLPGCVQNDFRIESKGLNDCILISTCRLLMAGYQQTGVAKPLQFHTGLGDNDISLLRSNPAHLQPLIEKFPDIVFVLLHSSYPYTRQAGYLATVFKNVYLDLGEVFPMVSRDGQEHIIRQAMEITPMTKLLYSTDAHHWAEVYWLADKQFRHALERVLVDYVENEDLTVQEAIAAAKDIYFNNSNDIYSLELELPSSKKKILQLGWDDSHSPAAPATSLSVHSPYDTAMLRAFLQKHNSVDFIYIQWLDYMATLRVRIFPIAEFKALVSSGRRFSIARGNTGTLQNDAVTPACTPVGQILVEPDLSTLRSTHSKDPLKSATVIASFRDEDGSVPPFCPRSTLQRLVTTFETIHNLAILVGFEIELVLLRPTSDKDNPYTPTTTNHAWGTLTPEQHSTTIPILAEIVRELEAIGIPIQHFHSESGPGQYELVLPPLPPITAVDTLVQTRQVMTQIAHSHGLRATLHPTPLGAGASSGQHTHLSLASTNTASAPAVPEQTQMAFFAGVLTHLPSICAFTLPNSDSYARVRDDAWTGGTWCAWGTQNREVPLRRVGATHWEVRCVDGFANPYFALSAILAAGLVGVGEGMEMEVGECRGNPAGMSEEEREGLGVRRRLPRGLEEALEALEGDEVLKEGVGGQLVEDYVGMKRVEMGMMDKMEEVERRVWLVERY